ncbi:MAG: rhamnulokinase [Acidobacteriia bacterium]|nr:rhamnulokinase [Terriglobia bacterium]
MKAAKKSQYVAAVDLGAESGRVVLCRWDGAEGTLTEVHRFPNTPHHEGGHLVWDPEHLWQEIRQGLSRAASQAGGDIASVAVDGWGVDYVLVDRSGDILGRAYCYRDARNLPQMERAYSLLPRQRIYEITGIQFLPFNTIYQLMAHVAEFPDEWARAAFWLNLPEYFQYRLSGVAAAEYTEASTTQLLDVHTRSWSQELAPAVGLGLEKFPPLVEPGTRLGKVRGAVAQEVGLPAAEVIAPACHDTGSAVAGIPFSPEQLAFISSGTWSLVGTVLLEPVVSEQGLELNYTNEGGVAGSVRFLKNVIGLWLLQECLREWKAQGMQLTAADLARQCADISASGPAFDADETAFLAPGNMVARINAALEAQGFPKEERPVELAAIIFRSLARRYAQVLKEIQSLTGKSLARVAIVGGGVRNQTLNRLTGELTGLEVLRGPSEATAAGNVAVQIGTLENATSLSDIRAISAKLQLAGS